MRSVGRYMIRGLLGRGLMARVYKVSLPVIGKIAALKLLDPDDMLAAVMGRRKLHDRFISEARAMASLNHPNIVAVHDFDLDHDTPFYVMDFFPGNLGDMIGESYRIGNPSRIIDTDKALDYTRQTLSGLACLHDAGIIHRDIKPFNLLITAQDTVRIGDFGMSRLRGETFGGPDNLRVGSPFYAAPEQEHSADAAGPAADLYAVGVMLYRMLTGRLPALDIRYGAYHPPARLNPDLDDAWDGFLARALAPNPESRFAGAPEMLKALDELQGHWQRNKERICRLRGPEPAVNDTKAAVSPRSSPLKVRPAEAQAVFGLGSLWRPQRYVANELALFSGGVVADRATGLVWQQSGSPCPRDRDSAFEYVARLCENRFGGYENWRLPTIDELITLLRPPPRIRDLCVDPVFDPAQCRIWSADRRSFIAAYYVDTVLGFVGWQDFSAPFHVRAVCSASPPFT